MDKKIIAIDTHTHINHGTRYDSNPKSLLYDATLEYLQKANAAANIDKMFCSTFSSVIAREDIEMENQYMFELSNEVDNLYQWVVLDPENEKTFRQAEKMLGTKKCVGIKLHPVLHEYTFKEFGEKLCSFASEISATVQIHPEGDPDYILPYADKYKNVTFIMAHMGSYTGPGTSYSDEDSYAKAIEFSKWGNVYVDTSGGASSKNKVIEHIVNRVGSERILFGTDTYAAGFQYGRIEYALISEEDKLNILRKNAERLFADKLK